MIQILCWFSMPRFAGLRLIIKIPHRKYSKAMLLLFLISSINRTLASRTTGVNSQPLRPAHALSLFTCRYLSPIVADHVHILDLSSAIFPSETRSTLIGGQGGIARHVHKIRYRTEPFSKHKLAEEDSAGW